MTKLEILTNKSVKILEMDILENEKYYENKNFESCPNIVSYPHTKDIDVTFLEIAFMNGNCKIISPSLGEL